VSAIAMVNVVLTNMGNLLGLPLLGTWFASIGKLAE
jgi:hypothetical protein